ncbi:MAG: hypothetical protein IJP75_11435 [Bacteroidaceae bacterium]|nr:hypothetical protein [Bacteroidaceae bacterium]
MMRLLLTRYYGDKTVTKSILNVWVNGKHVMECEARELAYRHYTEKFPGSTLFCIPCGVFKMRGRSTKYGPMTLRTQHMPVHSDVAIGWEMPNDPGKNVIVVGRSDGNPDPMMRGLVASRETFDQLTHYVYQTFGINVTLTVTDEGVLTEDEYWLQMAENKEISMEK